MAVVRLRLCNPWHGVVLVVPAVARMRMRVDVNRCCECMKSSKVPTIKVSSGLVRMRLVSLSRFLPVGR